MGGGICQGGWKIQSRVLGGFLGVGVGQMSGGGRGRTWVAVESDAADGARGRLWRTLRVPHEHAHNHLGEHCVFSTSRLEKTASFPHSPQRLRLLLERYRGFSAREMSRLGPQLLSISAPAGRCGRASAWYGRQVESVHATATSRRSVQAQRHRESLRVASASIVACRQGHDGQVGSSLGSRENQAGTKPA